MNANGCDFIPSAEECLKAAAQVGVIQEDIEVLGDVAPPGCFIHDGEGPEVYYNYNVLDNHYEEQTTRSDTALVCSKENQGRCYFSLELHV